MKSWTWSPSKAWSEYKYCFLPQPLPNAILVHRRLAPTPSNFSGWLTHYQYKFILLGRKRHWTQQEHNTMTWSAVRTRPLDTKYLPQVLVMSCFISLSNMPNYYQSTLVPRGLRTSVRCLRVFLEKLILAGAFRWKSCFKRNWGGTFMVFVAVLGG